MKFTIEVDGTGYSLDQPGNASIVEVSPNVFSVLLGTRSFTVRVGPGLEDLEVWVSGGRRQRISVADARDRAVKSDKASAAGPVEVRAQMPGKIVKVLVEVGAQVSAGEGLLVIEAMKMQNELKAPKDGKIAKIYAAEGAAVVAGESLIVVE